MKFMNHLERIMAETYISEVTAEEKYLKQYNGKLERALFDKAVGLDPTSTGNAKVGRYTDWIIKNKLFDTDSTELADLLIKFDKYKNKIPLDKRDINKINYDILKQIIADIEVEAPLSKKEKKDENRLRAEEESDVLLNTSTYIVVTPNTMFASQYYGAGSDWCTARQDDYRNMFNSYDRDGKIYIIMNKSTKEKFQLWKSNNNKKSEYKNKNNEDFSPFDEFGDDEDMMDWMRTEKFTHPNEVTEEQATEYAIEFLDDVKFYKHDDDDFWNDAVDRLVNYFRGYEDYGFDDPSFNIHDYIKEQMADLVYQYEQSLEFLISHGLDPDSVRNKINLISMMSNELFDELKREFEENDDIDGIAAGTLENWDYVKTIHELLTKIEETNRLTEFEDLDLEIIKKWLEYSYKHDFSQFETFYDDFVRSADDILRNPLTDEAKSEIKELHNKVSKVMYSRDENHPKLDLQSFKYLVTKTLRYL